VRSSAGAGATTADIARQALAEDFGGWADAHRLVANVDAIRREQEGVRSHRDPLDVMAMMARMARMATMSRLARG
jgi:hypothetical protein